MLNHYNPPKFEKPISLELSRNESDCVIDDLPDRLLSIASSTFNRYPSQSKLQQRIGEFIHVDPARIVITAGGDESIDRMIRSSLAGNRKRVVSHAPSFEMIDVYTSLYRGQVDAVCWLEGPFPVEQLIEKVDSSAGLVVLVSPNNPTGQTIDPEVIYRVADRCAQQGIKLLLDHAYIEFADQDPTPDLLDREPIHIVRTFSKAWGLAGQRVGYLIAPTADRASEIRNLAGPFPVSGLSLELAYCCLESYQSAMDANLQRVQRTRDLMAQLISDCGGRTIPSQGNFVLAEFSDADRIWEELAVDGIGVRKFAGSKWLTNHLRITCPVPWGDYLTLAQSLCRIHQLDFEFYKNELLESAGLSPVESPNVTDNSGLTAIADSQSIGPSSPNKVAIDRKTKETNIQLDLNVYGSGLAEIETGIGFLDHMLTALAFHSKIDLSLKCRGDLHVDDHHTSEDCAIAIGQALDRALGNRAGIRRFGFAYAPLDESLARTVIDLSARPWPSIHLQLQRQQIGEWACENIVHFFQSLAINLKCSMHVDVLRGSNDHHRVEAAFKSLAMALRTAVERTQGGVPSTKGTL